MGPKPTCVLCHRFDETKITGVLSTKDDVTAHQNCLLFSSGIYCRNTPQFDDLFGFSVEDVKEEVKRGSKLFCHRCKKKGATAGCEVKRCKKSYHYPCAVQEGAQIVEDSDEGNYGLYCLKHDQQKKKNSGSDNESTSSSKHSEAGPSKRRLSFNNKQEEPQSKRKSGRWNTILTDQSSDSDQAEPNADFAPLEYDADEDANREPQLIRKDVVSPTVTESKDGPNDGAESDADSVSLLPPAESSAKPLSLSQTTPTSETASAANHSGMPGSTGNMVNGDAPPAAPPSEAEPSINSTSFWRSCNVAGCTKAIFTDFIEEMNEISSRIQTDQASQQDYDLALKVMEASGKLEKLVKKRQKELKMKQMELQMATVAMKDVISALRGRLHQPPL